MARGFGSRLSVVAGIVFALGSLGGGAALAGSSSTTRTKMLFSMPVQSPCNGEIVGFTGETAVIFHSNQSGSGMHVVISDTAQATGTGNLGNSYILSAQGNEQFDRPTVDGTYDVPFHAEIISEGAAPNFTVDGTDTAVVSGGVLTAFFLSSVDVTSIACHGS
jgi:hypothetical protein